MVISYFLYLIKIKGSNSDGKSKLRIEIFSSQAHDLERDFQETGAESKCWKNR